MDKKATRDIVLSVELDASPEDVFRAVADGTELAKWLAPGARVTPPSEGKPGTIWISWGEGMSVEHEIEIFDAPRRIRHPSGKNAETKAPLYADWTIEARDGGKATLRLVHSGFSVGADWDDDFDAHARGWRLMLENLRESFARHPHEPAVHVPFMAEVDSPHGALFDKLATALGLSTLPQVGDAFRAGALSGEVDHVTPGRALGLVVREYGDALLRFTLEGTPGTFVYGYVIVYGDARERADELLAAGRSLV